MKPDLSFASVLTAGCLLVGGPALRASETGDRIEAAVNKSYVPKTCLAEDRVQGPLGHPDRDRLAGAHRSFAQDTIESVTGVDTVSDVAKNASEKSLVTKLASDDIVVFGVVNEMTIVIASASAR